MGISQGSYQLYKLGKMSPKSQEKRFVFVGGPSLTGKGDGIRSKLIQEGMREKRLERQKNAAAEIKRLLSERTTADCSCRMAIVSSAPSQSLPQGQPIKPRPRNPNIEEPIHCSFCSRYVRSYGTGGSVHDLGSGLSDPMIPINERSSRLKVREIFSFACRHIFPNLRSLDQIDLYQTWAFPFDDDDLKLFTFLWSSKYHEDVLRLTYRAPEDTAGPKQQLILKGHVLRALQKEVACYTGQKPIDSIIRSMLALAVNEKTSERIYREPSPFAPVFTGLHGLEVYGSRDYSPIHWKVMHELLQNHGGVEALQLFALAWQVSVAGLLHAAHTLQKPLYPMIDVYGQRMELDPPLSLFAQYGCSDCADSKSQKPGSGFNELLSMEHPVHEELVIVFSRVGELSHVMQYMSIQPCSSLNYLISLPTAEFWSTTDSSPNQMRTTHSIRSCSSTINQLATHTNDV
ncbi:hypothetical protein BJX63DRAFT_387390 [Aspergillus granulosus]|uniref:Uncharacterized protein n=1 Tax=Aspergillus granulosus TaxID=176169 RepID=A0ABR4HP36_9EURO